MDKEDENHQQSATHINRLQSESQLQRTGGEVLFSTVVAIMCSNALWGFDGRKESETKCFFVFDARDMTNDTTPFTTHSTEMRSMNRKSKLAVEESKYLFRIR